MKKHTKKYLEFYEYDECDFIPSEIDGDKAVDLHHISKPRSNEAWNIMALTRDQHEEMGDKTKYMEELKAAKFTHMNKFLIDKLLDGDSAKALMLIATI